MQSPVQPPMLRPVPNPSPERFDARYYRRFYLDPRTRAVSRAEIRRSANLIAAFLQETGCPVRRILDLGCGLGLMRAPLREHFPRASYTGVEVSEYLCRRFGWTLDSVHTYRSARPYDLVICHDVVQYLDARAAAEAVRNLGRLCRGVLHFSVLTTEDWEQHCDQQTTDGDAHLRPAAWYRRHLAADFINAGSGMFVRRGAPIHLWELDRLEPPRRGRGG
jgi:SAM-dependent methyltransferase